MAQASSWWQQFINSNMQGWSPPEFRTKALKSQFLHRYQGPGGWLLNLTVVVTLLFWNWRLLLAMMVGMLVMVLVYSMPGWNWQIYWSDIRRFLNSSNRQLTLAVGSGSIATFSTYLAAAIWIDSDSPWIAVGAIIQGLGTLVTLILLIWQIVSWQTNREETKLDQLLTDLTDVDPLTRLIAVRQMTRLVTRSQFDSTHYRTANDCLRLLLIREQEDTIREAVFESLQALDRVQQISVSEALSSKVSSIPLSKI